MDRRIPYRDITPDPVVRGRRKHDDAVCVTDGRIGFDEVVIAREQSDSEIGCRTSRVAVAACLVPPERVIGTLDSYAAAGTSGIAISDRHVTLDANS